MSIPLIGVQTHKPSPIRKRTVSKNKKWYKATVVEGQGTGVWQQPLHPQEEAPPLPQQ